MPASRAAPTARTTLAGSWVRLSAASTRVFIDCTPIETRLTPAATRRSSCAAIDRVGVALDRHLGARPPRDRVEDPGERRAGQQRRCAATEEDRRRLRDRARRDPTLDVGHAGVDVLVDQVGAVGPGREVAVVAAVRAERDVHVHAEPMGRHDVDAPTCRCRASWRRPSAWTSSCPPRPRPTGRRCAAFLDRARAGRAVPRRFHPAARGRRVRRPALAAAVGPGRVGDRAAGDRRGAARRRRTATDEPDRHRLGRRRRCIVAGTPEQHARYLPGLLDGTRDLVPAVQRAGRRQRPRVAHRPAPSATATSSW